MLSSLTLSGPAISNSMGVKLNGLGSSSGDWARSFPPWASQLLSGVPYIQAHRSTVCIACVNLKAEAVLSRASALV